MRIMKTDAYEEFFEYHPIKRSRIKLDSYGKWSSSNENVESFHKGDITTDWIIQQIKNGSNNIIGYPQAMFMYAMPLFEDKITWDMSQGESIDMNQSDKSFVKALRSCVMPGYVKNECISIWRNPPMSFEDYVVLCHDVKDLEFDLDSCLSVYRLQGDACIPLVIHQMFNNSDGKYEILPDKDVECRIPEVSPYISGTVFPCLVSKKPSKLESRADHGCISIMSWEDSRWKVFDMVCTGNFSLVNRSLSERLSFFGSGGESCKSFVCWDYIDLVEAWKMINGDCVVRNMRETLSFTTWFTWGLGAWVHVKVNGAREICGKGGSTGIKFSGESKNSFFVMTMDGDFVKKCNKSDLIYSSENLLDFIELLS